VSAVVTSASHAVRFFLLALCLIVLVACGGGENSTGDRVGADAVEAAFRDVGIELSPIADPQTQNESIVALLGPPDSDQIAVTILRDDEQAQSYVRAVTGREPSGETSVGNDLILLTANVVVVFDSTGDDYRLDDVNRALAQLSR